MAFSFAFCWLIPPPWVDYIMGAHSSKISQQTLYAHLGVDQECTDAELKKAYYKKALELHPDRNAHRIEEATLLFAKLQAAYDLLTNPQERDFYDTQLKNPKYESFVGGVTSAESVRQITNQVLASRVVNFTLISEYFKTLKQEEQEAAFQQGVEPPFVLMESPTFGSKNDDWAVASKFYDAWSVFATIKDFAWEDMYPLHTAQDRKTKRKFEQQNKKLRDAAKREFNQAVLNAVTQLRQIDPRKPKPKPKPRLAKPPQRTKHENSDGSNTSTGTNGALQYVEQHWQTTEQQAEEPSECFVCESQFETEFDLMNHEQTAKHKRKLAELKQKMLMEDELMGNLKIDDEPEPAKPVSSKPGKAKSKAKRKKQAMQQLLMCSTCGQEMMSDELIAHKQITRHT